MPLAMMASRDVPGHGPEEPGVGEGDAQDRLSDSRMTARIAERRQDHRADRAAEIVPIQQAFDDRGLLQSGRRNRKSLKGSSARN